ncbi:MAG: TonB-dependent receptor [Deltaproteobacteria bacterium]|nr:TonB-dependent receptor [Deltaproteobacteria bacterium]
MNPSLIPPYFESDEEDIESGGGHLLGRWERSFSDDALMSLQFYYDRTEYDFLYGQTTVDTIDFEFNHHFSLGSRHDIVWGLGYRFVQDDLVMSTPFFQLDENSRKTNLFSGFAQDEIRFMDDRVRVIIGSKFEHNDYTGFEIQPSARISWSPEGTYTIWAAASRAVRTPSRVEDGFQFAIAAIPAGAFLPFFPGAGVAQVIGNGELDTEDLTAFEMGFRAQPMDNFSVDVAVFYNIYDDLRGGPTGMPFFDMLGGFPVMVVPSVLTNYHEGESYGFELAADWLISRSWKLKASYTYFEIEREIDEGGSPQHQASLRSMVNLSGNLTFDVWCRYVDGLLFEEVDSYLTADVRLSWQVSNNLELSVTGRNLLEPSRAEYIPQFMNTVATEIERSIYGKIVWKF